MKPGTVVRCAMTKWGARPHWEFSGYYLGEDEHGHWVGFPTGTLQARPGLSCHTEVDAVTLYPRNGWFCATFHSPGIWCDRYVDICTPPAWDVTTVGAVDLDLDVVRMSRTAPMESPLAPQVAPAPPGATFIDDEDEFAEHQITFGYPADVIAAARASAEAILEAVRTEQAPWDATGERWLDALTRQGLAPLSR